ncbi:MAG: Smr/MutS family protein [Bacteroidales bacterium]
MLYPSNFEEKIEFNKVRERIADKCISNLGREKVNQIKISYSQKFISKLVSQVAEFKEVIEFEENFPLDHCVDVRDALEKIRIEGTHPEVEEVYHLRLNQATIKKIITFFNNNREEEKYLSLFNLTKNITLYNFVSERIDRTLTPKGDIKNNASQDLKNIRNSILQKENQVSGKINKILERAKSKGIVNEETNLSIRHGRTVIPVEAGNKRKINGLVQDESASGRTVYIEPTEIVELNNEIRELHYAEKREIIKILTDLADDLRPYIDELLTAIDFLGTIDFIRAKALYAKEINAIKPAVVSHPHLRWIDAVHPVLYLNYKAENKEVVPLSITLDKKSRIIVISGPNAGGKSVCLKTIGLLQYMFQCGLLIPVKYGSEAGIFRKIFINIGDDQSIENDLSTYSSHLVNMKNFLKYADEDSIILIDEFGAGTEPILGGAIAESILDALNQKGVMGAITTHYANLKHFASEAEGIENGAMLFDAKDMKPLYKLTIGEPGSSFAFEIAKKIGLPQNVLKEASSKVGKQHIDYDKNLKDIIRDKQYWENKRESIKAKEKKIEKLLDKYAEELKDAKNLKKKIKKEAQEEAQQLLAQINKKIENTIRQIKESQAEKEKTKQARKELEEFKEQALQEKPEELDSKIHKIEHERKKVLQQPEKQKSETRQHKEYHNKLNKGDKVQLKGRDSVGEIIDVNEKSVLIAFGNILTTIPYDQIEKISEEEYQKEAKTPTSNLSQNYNLGKRKMEFHPELDIRGKRADEALQMVRDFIDEAIVVNTKQVRILHGKGNGILRQLVRKYLSSVDMVKHFGDENVEYGGSGITVVDLDY